LALLKPSNHATGKKWFSRIFYWILYLPPHSGKNTHIVTYHRPGVCRGGFFFKKQLCYNLIMIEKASVISRESGLNAIETLEQIIHETPGNPHERQDRIDKLKEIECARSRGEKVLSAVGSGKATAA
jgi:hypothetical protein